MKTVSSCVSICLNCLLLLMLVSRCPTVHAAVGSVAIIIGETGQVQVSRGGNGEWTNIYTDGRLNPSDKIETGPDGKVDILFSDNTQTKLNSNSGIVVVGTTSASVKGKNLFDALWGVIWAHLKPFSRIHVDPSNSDLVDRGTDVLIVIPGDGSSTVTVISGSASYSNSFGNVNITSGMQSTATAGEAPTAPIAIDPSGLISWTADVVGLPLLFESPETNSPILVSGTDHTEAIQLAGQLLTSPSVAGYIRLGNLLRSVGDAAGAVSAFQSALSIEPNNRPASECLSLTELSQGNSVGARATLMQFGHQAGPVAIVGLIDLEMGQSSSASQEFRAALAVDPRLYSAEDLLALVNLQDGDVADAQMEAFSSVTQAPHSAQAQGTYSTVLLFEGKIKQAGEAAKKALIIDQQSPFALLAEARFFVAVGQYDRACLTYEKALAFAPDLWLIHQELGDVYDQLGDPGKAREEYEIALQLDPHSPDALAGDGVVLAEQGRYAKAESSLKQAMMLAPSDASVVYDYGSFLIERGRLDEAVRVIEMAASQHAKFGLLYARLAEVYLYQQNLGIAQQNAIQAVKLLPKSGLAHYELGRVYFEEERTYQAEEEFRIATVFDPKLSTARYALGLVEEKTQSELLTTFSSIFDTALIGSTSAVINPSSQFGQPPSPSSLNDLAGPGANERLQAALEDPTAVRVASRSYGDAELDAVGGSRASDDIAGSYLTEVSHNSAVIGVNGETDFQNGIRDQDDTTGNVASFVFGQKANKTRPGYLLLGEYAQTDTGLDDQVEEFQPFTLNRDHSQGLNLIGGIKVKTGGESDLLIDIQAIDHLEGIRSVDSTSDSNYFTSHFDTDSLNGEVRWNISPNEPNALTAGISYGDRHLASQAYLGPTLLYIWYRLTPLQAYIRDDISTGGKWSFVTELQMQQDFPTNDSIIPSITGSNTFNRFGTTKALPYGIADYQADTSTIIRFRYRQLLNSVTDFQLLNPVDDFLLTYVDLIQPISGFQLPIAQGTSAEAEVDKSFSKGEFLSFGVFRQDLTDAQKDTGVGVGAFQTSRIQGGQVSIQGSLSQSLSYFLLGEVQNSDSKSVPGRIPLTPNFIGLSTLQYLNTEGFYGQAAFYYQGDRIADDGSGSDLGAFGVLNLRTGRRFGLATNVFAELDNVLDKQYDDFGIIQQGTELKAGVTQRF